MISALIASTDMGFFLVLNKGGERWLLLQAAGKPVAIKFHKVSHKSPGEEAPPVM